MFEYGPYYRSVGEGKLDVARLEKLRAGDSSWLIESLETELDGHLLVLSNYEDTVPPGDRSQDFYVSLRRIAAYRRAHPRPPFPGVDGPNADALLQKALTMAEHGSGLKTAP